MGVELETQTVSLPRPMMPILSPDVARAFWFANEEEAFLQSRFLKLLFHQSMHPSMKVEPYHDKSFDAWVIAVYIGGQIWGFIQ